MTTQGDLSSLHVVREETAHSGVIQGIETGQFWSIMPSDGGYSVDLTLPQAALTDPQACRYTDPGWDCAGDAFTSSTVTRNGIVQLSDWAVGVCTAAVTPTSTSINLTGVDVDLTWTDNSANAGGYEVHRSIDPFFTPDSGSWLANRPASSTSYTDEGAAGVASENYTS